MENKLKAALVTLFILIVWAGVGYGLLYNVQFLGILLVSILVVAVTVGIYKSFYTYFKTKSKTNKNNQP